MLLTSWLSTFDSFFSGKPQQGKKKRRDRGMPVETELLEERVVLTPPVGVLDIYDGTTIPVDTDPIFDVDGFVTTSLFATGLDVVNGSTVQADGKIIVVGQAQSQTTAFLEMAVARYNTDGSLDTTFNTTGKFQTGYGNKDAFATSVVVDSAGKIYVAGWQDQGSNSFAAIIRLNSNGTLDTTFDSDGKLSFSTQNGDDRIRGIVLDSSGRIVVAGESSSSGNFAFFVARMSAAGVFDSTFDGDGKAVTNFAGGGFDGVTGLAIQSDGKIVVGGYSDVDATAGVNFDFAVARYLATPTGADASLDSTFGTAGKATYSFGTTDDRANKIRIQPDGKIVAAGYTNTNSGDFAVLRVSSTGVLDPTFDTDGKVTYDVSALMGTTGEDRAQGMQILSTGNMVFSGYITPDASGKDSALLALTTTGALYTDFNAVGYISTDINAGGDDAYNSIGLQANGKLIATGFSGTTNSDFSVARYTGDIPLGKTRTTISAGNLTIEDLDTNVNNIWTLGVSADGLNLVFGDAAEFITTVGGGSLSNSNHTFTIPLSTITGTVTINGVNGNDQLTIDFTNGSPIPASGLTFNGGSQASIPGDGLTLTGGLFATGTFAFTNANDGTINLAGSNPISYTGLEPIVTTGSTIDNLIFTFNGGAETITLTDAAGAAMTIDSTAGESLTFANPSGSVTINAGTDADTVNIEGVDALFAGNLIISGDAGTDTVNWNTTTSVGSLNVTAESIALQSNVTSTGSQVYNGPVTLTGNRTINSTDVQFNSTVDNGVPTGPAGHTILAYNNFGASGTSELGIGNQASGNPDWTFANNAAIYTVKNIAVLVRLTAGGGGSGGTTQVFTNVAEAAAYTLVYQLAVPNGASFNSTSIPYSVNTSGSIVNGSFDRIAYYMELTSATYGTQYAYVSMDAFTANAAQIGVPSRGANGAFPGNPAGKWQQNVANMNVFSSNPAVYSGTGLTTGSIEFWNTNYSATNSSGVPNASNGTYDFGDTPSGSADYSSMQVHNYGVAVGAPATLTINSSGSGAVTFGAAVGATSPLGTLTVNSVNVNAGSIATTTGLAVNNTGSGSTITGVISGATSTLTKSGAGTLVLSGSNTFGGATAVNAGGLTLSGGAAIADTVAVTVANVASATLTLNASETIGSLAGGGTTGGNVTLGANILTVGDATNTTYAGVISSTGGGLTKQGIGMLTLSGANTYTGTTLVSAGTLALSNASNNNLANSATINLASTGTLNVTGLASGRLDLVSGQTLQGTGTVTGELRPLSSSIVSPNGASTGILNLSNGAASAISLQSGSTLSVQVNGNVAGTNYDQLNVTGTANVTGSTLNVTGTISTVAGQSIVLVNNDGSDAIIGTFNGLPEGSTVTVNGINFLISYVGGSNNNDVVLVQAETNISVVSGNLVITDINGANTSDTLTIKSDTTNSRYVITEANAANSLYAGVGATQVNASTVYVAFAAVTGNIQVNTLGGNDNLTVDFSLGNFGRAIAYNGGTQVSTPGDSLNLAGGTIATGTFAFTNSSTGTVDLTGNSQISYTGLEPIVSTGTINNVILTFNGGAETITLTDAAGAAMTVTSTLGETLTFANPSTSVTINAGTGDDTINLQGVDGAYIGNLTVNGDGGTDAVNFQTNPTGITGGSVAVTTETITVSAAISTAGGSVTLTATNGVTLSGVGGDVSTSGGAFTVNADSDNDQVGTYSQNNAGSAVSTAGGPVSITAANVDLVGTINASTGTVTVVPSVPVAPPAVTNGTFTSNISGWTTSSGNVVYSSQGGGQLWVNDGAGPSPYAEQAIAGFSIGTGYQLDWTLFGGAILTAGNGFRAEIRDGVTVIASLDTGNPQNIGSNPAGLAKSLPFTATNNTLTIRFIGQVGGDFDYYVDNVTFGGSTTRAITLGSEVAGTLSLTDTELDLMSAATINVGNTNSGNITVTNPITLATNASLTTGGSIALGTNSIDVTASKNLGLTTGAAGSLTVTDAVGNDVVANALTISAGSAGVGTSVNPLRTSVASLSSATSGNANQYFTEADSLSIVSWNAGTGTIEIDGGTFNLNGSGVINDSTTVNVNNASGTLGVGTYNETISRLVLTTGSVTGTSGVLTSTNTILASSGNVSAILAGTNGLTKSTTSTVVLTGTNTYTGATTISQGTLQVGNAGTTGSIATASTVTLGDGSTGANDVAFLVNRSDVNTHANAIVVSTLGSGTATIGSAGSSAGALATTFGGTVTLNRATTLQGLDPDRTTYQGIISGNVGTLTVTGGGRTTLEAGNTFVGNVVVTGSGTILQVGPAGNQIPDASNVDLAAGTFLRLDADGESINALTGTGTVENVTGANTLTVGANNGSGTFAGTLTNGSGVLSLIKSGSGTVTLSGTNTLTGTTTVNDGGLTLSGGTALPDAGAVILANSAGALLTLSNSETIGSLSGGGTAGGNVALGANTLTVGDATSPTYSGAISGINGNVTKQGNGTLTLAGTSSYTGTTQVDSGTLVLTNAGNNNISGSATIHLASSTFLDVTGLNSNRLDLASGQTLSGAGTVSGHVNLLSGSTISPNGPAATGILNLSRAGLNAISMQSGSAYSVQVNGNVAGSSYDELNVTGTVDVTGVTFTSSGTITSSPGQNIVIVNNDGSDAVIGTFNGLPEGSTVTINSVNFVLTYSGGPGGNDIVLREIGSQVFDLPIDGAGTVARIVRNGANLQLVQGATILDSIPLSTITSLTVNGENGLDDTLTVDYTNGDFAITPAFPITFNGGTGGNDALVTVGGSFTVLTSTYLNAHDGTIELSNGSGPRTINYTGLEPITVGGTLTDVIINLPAAASNAILEDDGTASNGIIQLRSGNGTFETTTFGSPSNSLTINSGNVADTLNVTVPTTDYNAAMTLGTLVAPLSSATFTAAQNITAGGGTVTVHASTVTVTGLLTATGAFTTSATTINLNTNIDAASLTGTALAVNVNSTTVRIQDGITLAANAGSTITLAAGVYTQSPTLNFSETLRMGGNVTLDSFSGTITSTLDLGLAGNTLTLKDLDPLGYDGTIIGAGNLSLDGVGQTFILAGDSTYTGTTTLVQPDSTLIINNSSGSATGTGNVSIFGTLSGGGSATAEIDGNVNIKSGGRLVSDFVSLTIGVDPLPVTPVQLTFEAGSKFEVSVDPSLATTPIVVNGTVDSNSAVLHLIGTPPFVQPYSNTTLDIITINDGVGAMSGQFALRFGAPVATVPGTDGLEIDNFMGQPDLAAQYHTTYGFNDVVFTFLPTTLITVVAGDLVITDVRGGTSTDMLTIAYVTDDAGGPAAPYYLIMDPNLLIGTDVPGELLGIENPIAGANYVKVPATLVTGKVIVRTLAGDDTVSVVVASDDSLMFPPAVPTPFPTGLDIDSGLNTDILYLSTDVSSGTFGVVVSATESIYLGGNVTATSGNIILDAAGVGQVILSSDVSLSTASGNVTIGAPVNADDATANDRTLTVSAVGGTVTFSSTVGATEALADFDVTGALIRFGGNLTVNDGTVSQTATFTGPVQLDASITVLTDGTIDNSVDFVGAINADAAGNNRTLTTSVGSGTGRFRSSIGATEALADFDVNAATGLIRLGGNITATAGAARTVTLTGPVQLDNTVAVNTDGTNDGHIVFTSTVNGTTVGGQGLTLAAGTGDITLTGIVGAGTRLGALSVVSAHDVNAVAITAASLNQSAGSGLTTLNGAVNVNGAAGVTLTGTNLLVNAGITTITGGGGVTFNESGTVTIIGAGDINADGPVSMTATGGISTAGDVTTTNDDVTFVSPVTLTGSVPVNTGAGAGNIAFNSTVNGTTLGGQNLTLTAGTGSITLSGVVGGGTRLGILSVASANNVTAVAINSTSLNQTAGTGTTTLNGPVNTSGVAGVTLTGTNLVVNFGVTTTSGGVVTFNESGTANIAAAGDITSDGAVSITATGGISTAGNVLTTADAINFFSAVTLTGDVALDTAGLANITFSSTINDDGAISDRNLTVDARTGNLSVVGAVGAIRPLQTITINTANNVTFSSTVATSSTVTQVAGTGTTTFNGGTIGGNLSVITDAITLNTATLTTNSVTLGGSTLTAQNAVTLNAALHGTASTLTILANQDNLSNQGFTQNAGGSVSTTNDTTTAVTITVGGSGDAAIRAITTGLTAVTGGRATITAGGAITDADGGATMNITSGNAVLTAATGIGSSANPIETTLSNLEATGGTGGVFIANTGNLTIGGLVAVVGVSATGSDIVITTAGGLTVNEAVVNSGTGNVTLTAGVSGGVGSVFTRIAGPFTFAAAVADATSRGGWVATIRSGAENAAAFAVGGNNAWIGASDAAVEGEWRWFGGPDAGVQFWQGATPGSGGVAVGGEYTNWNGGSEPNNAGDEDAIHFTGGGQWNDLNAGNALPYVLETASFSATDDLILNANVSATGGNGVITLNGADDILQNSGTVSAAGSGAVDYNAATASATGVLTMTSGTVATSASGLITMDADGNVSLATVTTSGNALITSTTGAIVDNNAAAMNITAAGTSLSAATGVASVADPLETTVSNLAARTTSGGIFVTNTGALTITTVGAVTGITTGGSDTIINGSSSIQISQPLNAGAGSARLVAGTTVNQNASGTVTANNLGINAGGAVTLTAVANDAGTLAVNTNGLVEFRDANALTIGTVAASGTFAAANGVTSTGNNINLQTATTLAVNQVINAGAGDVRLRVGSSVSQNGSGVITANLLGVQGGTNIGLASVASNVNTIAVNTSGTIEYSDSNGLIIGTVPAGGTAGFTGTTGVTSAGNDVQILTGTTLTISNIINAGAGDLRLNAGGAVTQSATLTANGLALTGVGPFTLTQTTNDVNVIAANIDTGATGTDKTVNYVDANALTVGTVVLNTATLSNTTTGITTTADDVTLQTQTLGITISNTINLNGTATDGDLELRTRTGATQSVGANILGHGLALLGSGTYTLNNITNNVLNIAVDLTTQPGPAVSSVSYQDADDLHVAVVTGVTTTTTGIGTGDVGSANGGNVFLRAGQTNPNGQLFVDNDIDTRAGTNGNLTIGGGVVTSANLILGAGDIDLGGGANFPDIIVNTDTVITLSGGTATFQPNRDIIVRALLQSLNGGLTLNADFDNDGVGGVWVDETPAGTNAKIDAAGDLLIQGSDVFAIPAFSDSVRVDDDTTISVDQVIAAGLLTIQSKAAAPAGADIYLDGIVRNTTGATVTVTARDSVFLSSQVTSTSGSIVVTATTGSVVATDSGLAGAEILVNGGATITVNANGLTSLGSNVSVQSAGGGIIFNTNDFVADTTNSAVTATAAGIVTIRNFSAGRTIDVGTNAGGSLGITDGELDRITAQVIRIGRRNGTDSGTITVSAGPINATNSAILHLISGDEVVDTAGGFITETNLAVEASNDILLDTGTNDSTANDHGVSVLAMATYNAGSDATYVSGSTFTVGTVDGVVGIIVQDITTLQSGAEAALSGDVVQTSPIISNALQLLGQGNFTLDLASNDINILAADVLNTIIFNDVDDVTVGTINSALATTEGTSSSAITLTAPTVIVNRPIVTTSELGFVILDVTTLLDINGTIGGGVLVDPIINSMGFVQQTGTGSVQLQGQIVTTEDNVFFNGPVTIGTTIGSSALIDTGSAAGGNITFNSTVRGTTSSASPTFENLTLNAGTGDVLFNNQVGGGGFRMGVITVQTARHVTTNVGVTAREILQSAGTGETRFNGFVQTNQPNGIDLTSNYITFNGSIQTTNNGTVKIRNASDFQIVPGAGAINADGAVTQTGVGLNLIGGDIATTDDAISFAADTYISNTSVLMNARTGNVSFAKLLQVNNKTLTIRDGNAVDLGTRTTIANGTLTVYVGNAPSVVKGSLSMVSGALFTGAGTVNANMTVGTGATLAPASATTLLGTGILTVNGTVAMGSGAVFAVDLNSSVAGTGYDRLVIGTGGSLNLNSASVLQVNRNGAFTPSIGTALKVIDGTVSIATLFTGTTDLGALYAGGIHFSTDYNTNGTGDLTLIRIAPPAGPVSIIDNDGGSVLTAPVSGTFATVGSWSLNTYPKRGYTNDLRFAEKGTGAKTATWTFTGLIPGGTYRISTTWFPLSNRSNNAPFTINSAGVAPVTIAVNQRSTPNSFSQGGTAWKDLSTSYTLAPGISTLTVTLTNNTTTGYVIADAVRLEATGSGGPEIQVQDGINDIASGTGVVELGTITQPGLPISKTITVTNTGTNPLVLGSASLTAPAGFSIDGYAPQTIPAGGFTTFTVTLSNSTVGNFSGTISIATNDQDENPFNLRVSGSVVSADTKINDNLSGPASALSGSTGTGMTYTEVGTWANNTNPNVGYAQDLRFAAANSSSTATWAFTGLADGTYRISVTYRNDTNRATNASFTVTDGTTPVTVNINQRNQPGTFQSAGVYWQDLVASYGSIASGTLTVTLDSDGANGYVVADAIRIERIGALEAAGGPDPEPVSRVLTQDELNTISAAAIARWQQTDLTDLQKAALNGLQFLIQDLPGAQIGGATEATIFVDPNAAGYGWYVDETPADDAEFDIFVSETEVTATSLNAASRMDLLTVLMHEIGHRLGIEDTPVEHDADNLMTEEIGVGTRRFPAGELHQKPKDSDAEVNPINDAIFQTFGGFVDGSTPEAEPPVTRTGGNPGKQKKHAAKEEDDRHLRGDHEHPVAGQGKHQKHGKNKAEKNDSGSSLLGSLFGFLGGRKRK